MDSGWKHLYLPPELDEDLSKVVLATGCSGWSVVREADQSDNPLARLLALLTATSWPLDYARGQIQDGFCGCRHWFGGGPDIAPLCRERGASTAGQQTASA